MAEVAERNSVRTRTTAELTKALLGRPLTHAQLEDRLSEIQVTPAEVVERLWIGSVGYERFKDVEIFASHLRACGAERLIDVRELPISRRRGYAKTALAAALEKEGIDYVHLRGLGNPKPLRDLYKGGEVDAGRRGYSDILINERMKELQHLVTLLREKRCVLMCVEHDQNDCHRDVIFSALESELGLQLEIRPLAGKG